MGKTQYHSWRPAGQASAVREEGMGLGCQTSGPKLKDPLPLPQWNSNSWRSHRLPRQWHQSRSKCSNPWACRGHFTASPQQSPYASYWLCSLSAIALHAKKYPYLVLPFPLPLLPEGSEETQFQWAFHLGKWHGPFGGTYLDRLGLGGSSTCLKPLGCRTQSMHALCLWMNYNKLALCCKARMPSLTKPQSSTPTWPYFAFLIFGLWGKGGTNKVI